VRTSLTNRTESRCSVTVSRVTKIGGQQPGGLGAQDAPPPGVRSAWWRPEAGSGQDPAEGACTEAVSEPD
jgi:hypothetical protein